MTTFDNSITCIDTPAQSIDYQGCANFVEEYNYTELIRLGEQTASQIITKNAMIEAQINADPTDPAFLLRQQLKVVEGEPVPRSGRKLLTMQELPHLRDGLTMSFRALKSLLQTVSPHSIRHLVKNLFMKKIKTCKITTHLIKVMRSL